jgi:hypothetical protein
VATGIKKPPGTIPRGKEEKNGLVVIETAVKPRSGGGSPSDDHACSLSFII